MNRFLLVALLLWSGGCVAQTPTTSIANMPSAPSVLRTDWLIDQQGAGPNKTYKATVSQVFAAMNSTDVTNALGYTPLSTAGGTISGNLLVQGTTVMIGNLGVSGGVGAQGNVNSNTSFTTQIVNGATITLTGGATTASAGTIAYSGTGPLQLNSGGNTLIGSGSAILTTATTGFLLLPSMAGAPTGAAGGAAGKIPTVINLTDHKLCWNETGTTWKCVTGS